MTIIPIKFMRPWTWLLAIFGSPPRWSDIRVDGNAVSVRLGLAFHMAFDRRAVVAVEPESRAMVSIGAHGWRGRWLVNGASKPIASIRLREPQRAFVLGFPVRVHELLVSVADVAQLESALLG